MLRPMTTRSQKHLTFNFVQVLPELSGGIETYAHELISRIADRLDGWRITALVNNEGADYYPAWDDRVEWIPMGFSWKNLGRRLICESSTMPLKLRSLKPDLLHSMANTACLWPGCPQLTTIFDATQVLQPTDSIPMKVFCQLLRAAPRRSDLVVTISESAAADIQKAFGTSREKLRVALLAARERSEPIDFATLASRLDLPVDARYFLTPAARRANKNIAALLRAYAQLPKVDRPLLVLPGADGGFDDELNQLIADLELNDNVILPGWVEDEELDALYSHALALIFPSLMEGFGLPILEAMQCGCPVATSNVSSMPEIGGDAAVYFDPTDTNSIAASMGALCGDAALRERLAKAGPERASSFSWDRAADETVAIYEQLLN
jgi:glycosyltransferase involved in cell wall biosynthesis